MKRSDNSDKKALNANNLEDLPRRLGRYMLIKSLDGGGMTEVYAARVAEEVGPGRMLVIKILPKSSIDDLDAEARFIEEARLVLNFTHGNITAAFEFGREGGRPFLVMEYVPGPSLRHLLDSIGKAGQALRTEDALFIVREVSRALGYAHSFSYESGDAKGIVHRDVSPENILISTSGQVKLTDFGIAEFMRLSAGGPIWGKAAYIAPEVASGEPPSPASDLYSLGAVLYECLCGKPPFIGANDDETLELARTSEPGPLSAQMGTIPAELDSCLLRLLSKNPSERPLSASAVELEISSLLGNANLSYTEPELAETVRRHFSSESQVDSATGDFMRAGLLQAGVELNGTETTGELIATRTVPLGGTTEKKSKFWSAGRSLWLAAITVAVLAAVVYVSFQTNETDRSEDAAPRTIDSAEIVDNAASGRLRSPFLKSSASEAVEPRTEANAPKKPALRKAAKPKEQVKEKEESWGWLNINSYPWSYVSVDGKKLDGHTPHRRIKLKSGVHTLQFENPQLKLKASKKVDVKAWEETTFGIKLE